MVQKQDVLCTYSNPVQIQVEKSSFHTTLFISEAAMCYTIARNVNQCRRGHAQAIRICWRQCYALYEQQLVSQGQRNWRALCPSPDQTAFVELSCRVNLTEAGCPTCQEIHRRETVNDRQLTQVKALIARDYKWFRVNMNSKDKPEGIDITTAEVMLMLHEDEAARLEALKSQFASFARDVSIDVSVVKAHRQRAVGAALAAFAGISSTVFYYGQSGSAERRKRPDSYPDLAQLPTYSILTAAGCVDGVCDWNWQHFN